MTLGDIERLLPEARAEAAKVDTSGATGKDGPVPLLGSAVSAALEAARLLSLYHAIRWLDVRALCLRAAWMLLVVAWEAECTMCADGITWPKSCEKHGTHYPVGTSQVRENIIGAEPANKPKTPPPEPMREDLDELLSKAVAVATGGSHTWIGVRDTIMGLTAALRAERTRADGWRHAFEARGHLAAVIAHGWPEGTTAPAFLAGGTTDGADRRAHELLTAAGVHEDELPRRIDAPMLDREKARTEAQRLRADLATVNRFHASAVQERDEAKAELAASDEALAHERAEVAALRAELAAEQGKTKVHLDAANAWRERFNAEEKRRKALCEAAVQVVDMRDAKDGNGGRLMARPCSSGSCKGKVCGPAAELQSRLDVLAAIAAKGGA